MRGAYPKLVGRFPVSAFGEVSEQLRAGETFVVENMNTGERLSDATRAAFIEFNVYAIIGVPLIKDNHWVANFGVHHAQARRWTNEEIAIVQETAERTWAAVERVRAETTLQQSEAKYRLLFESIDAGFCVIEVLFDEHGKATDYRFLEANPAFEQQTGLVDAIAKPCVSWHHSMRHTGLRFTAESR